MEKTQHCGPGRAKGLTFNHQISFWSPGLLGTWQPVLELAGGGILSLPNGTLIIEEVSLTDEGLYSCNVENGVGQPLSKTIWMSVNSKGIAVLNGI